MEPEPIITSILGRGNNFSFPHNTVNGSGAHPAFYAMVMGPVSPWAKRPGHEAYHLTPSSSEVKNGGAIIPLLIRLHGVVVNQLIQEISLPITCHCPV
jgi:hypothetical protein